MTHTDQGEAITADIRTFTNSGESFRLVYRPGTERDIKNTELNNQVSNSVDTNDTTNTTNTTNTTDAASTAIWQGVLRSQAFTGGGRVD